MATGDEFDAGRRPERRQDPASGAQAAGDADPESTREAGTEAGAGPAACVLVVPPTPRDGEVTRRLLASEGIGCRIEPELARAAAALGDGVDTLMLTDITLATADVSALSAALAAQPAWAAVPVLALCHAAGQSRMQAALLDSWPNVTVLDRPTSTRGLLSALRACLRARQAQRRIREQLEELQHAEAALRGADRRKDEFLAVLAHELRNPLAPIRTGVELLTGSAALGEAERVRLRAMLDRQLAHMVKLVDDLLDVSRIATGKIALRRERLDLRQVAALALEITRPAVRAGGHDLAVEQPARALWVDGDETRLAQAVGNIVANAAKYTPDGGHLALRLAERDGAAELSVEDDGMGIPPAMLDRVFDLFTQVDASLERAQGGLGIGLSLVKSLVELHGGSVHAESDGAGRGSRFTLRLPLLPPPGAAEGAAEAAAEASGAAPGARAAPGDAPAQAQASSPRSLRVLVVDDNVDAADSLGLLVAMLGHETRVVYGGREALAAVDAFAPRVLISDIGMPGLDGHGLARALGRHPARAAMCLVALTGWGSEDDQRRARAAGFDRHLVKPAAIDGIESLLAEAAQRPAAAAGEPRAGDAR